MLKNIKLEGYTTKIPQHNTKLCKKLQKHSHHNIYPAISSKTESLKTVHPKKKQKKNMHHTLMSFKNRDFCSSVRHI